ncbi:hypothetical protein A2215_03265 [Candidatus Berkelbacteria bacterium RIFOXYA2_FULL_43_10]|uniref:Uncharacterized protein n=1 Tax=Candidatus Berkelbacteria bacterium RIFOXYA2_FULL_43_10 TaxID=1797472 RepID=A0A1F5EDS8_9BACT|nr:MAG: hypothetical protein A2215_03265 [Candidatus Berkelbacteria bacterium RIFOXYA2_FULL_43_10]
MGYRPWNEPSVDGEWKISLHMPLAEVRRITEGYTVIARIYHKAGDEMIATDRVAVVREDRAQIAHECEESVMRRIDDTRKFGWEEFCLSDPATLEQFHQAVLSLSNDKADYALWIHEDTGRVIVVETPIAVEDGTAQPQGLADAEQVPCDKVRCTRIVHQLVGDVIPRRVDGVGDGKVMRFRYCADCCQLIPVMQGGE